MWTYSLMAQAVGWAVLIAFSPFIFIFTRKIVRYAVYRFLPLDSIIEYRNNGKTTEAFYVKRSLFGRSQFRRLSDEEIKLLGAQH